MRTFLGKGTGPGFPDPSTLCPSCRKAFEKCFQKDEKGKIQLDFSHQPKLCEACKKKMKEQFRSSFHPDRG